MTWTRLSDDFFDTPPIYGLSRAARLLHMEALVWCNKHLTDGFLDRRVLRRLTDEPDPEPLVAELEASGVWRPVENGWQLDWSDQEQAEDVVRRKAVSAERSRAYRRRRDAHRRGDHSYCDARYCTGSATGDATHDADRDDTAGVRVDARGLATGLVPSGERLPDPSRPVPSRRDRDREEAGDPAPRGAAPGARKGWPAWCGECHPGTRQRENDQGAPFHCPACHPDPRHHAMAAAVNQRSKGSS